MLKTVSSIVNAIGALNYKGTWNANSNVPPLASGVGTKGDYYVVSTAGSTNLDGTTLWGVGDWAVFNGTIWQKVDGGDTSTVTSLTVTGLTGYMYANGSSPVTAATTIPVASINGAVANTVNVIAGTNMSGGGALTGNVTLNTVQNPTFTTSVTSPVHYGGTTASSSLTLQSTSGAGTSDAIQFKVGNAGAITAMYINTSGNILAGSLSAVGKLGVYGDAVNFSPSADNSNNGIGATILGQNVATATSALGRLYMTGGNTAHAGCLDLRSGSVVGSSVNMYNIATTKSVYIATDDNSYINNNYGLGIGTSSPSGYGRLAVLGNASAQTVSAFLSNAAGDTASRCVIVGKYDNNTTTSQVFMQFVINNNSATSGQINANGANQVAFGTWSDERLKENIVDLPPQLSNVCALRPVEFDYKNDGGHQIGFIAQEIEQVYPDAIGVGSDEMLTVTGWSKTEARLVKAIQELSVKNEALEIRLAALEAK